MMNGGYRSQAWEEPTVNGRPHTKRQGSTESASRDMKSAARQPSDAWNVQSDSEDTRQRRASMRSSNARSASRKRSKNALRGKESMEQQQEMPSEASSWIHRDKLAAIEIQEMEEAGIPVRMSQRSSSAGPGPGRTSRSSSRARRTMSKEQLGDPNGDEAYDQSSYGGSYGGYEGGGRKRVSTIPAADEEEHEFDPTTDTEFRSPAEIAAERESVASHVIRPSTSRIPVSRASPMPVPSNVVGRDSPLPRSRAGSGAWSGLGDDSQYARRARSNSIGSQVLLDDEPPARPGSAYDHSPQKARVPNKSTPTSGARKTSNATPGSRPGSSSNKLPRASGQRSSSRGHKTRPSTSHKQPPEGEAPWIAAMYKPDPRLPPDQQMLPTHAKRMMQERWETEGKTGTAYDRELNLLNNDAWPENKQSPPSPDQQTTPPVLNPTQPTLDSPPPRSPDKQQRKLQTPSPTKNIRPAPQSWPLSPGQEDARDGADSPHPGTSGGYKITPTISGPPPVDRVPQQQAPGQQAQSGQRTEITGGAEKAGAGSVQESKKKAGAGCGCCVMM